MKEFVRVAFLKAIRVDVSSECCNVGGWDEIKCFQSPGAKVEGDR